MRQSSLSIVAAVALFPSVAQGATYVVADFPTPPAAYSLRALGDDSADRVEIAGVAGGKSATYELTAATGLTTVTPCSSEGDTRVTCPRFGPKVIVSLGGADDLVRISAPMIADLRGGNGDDRLIGGPGMDGALGGEGDDVIRGSAGDDSFGGQDGLDLLLGGAGSDGLLGGKKPDVLLGGPGRDTISARDQRRDLEIDCGAGRDSALVDRELDPEPLNCEVVIFQPDR